MPKTVGIIDTNSSIKNACIDIIQTHSDYAVDFVCDTIEEGKAKLTPHLDVLLIDIRLKEGSGLEMVEYCQLHLPTIKVYVISMHESLLYVKKAMSLGATGYLSKRTLADELLDALETNETDKKYISAHLAKRLNQDLLST